MLVCGTGAYEVALDNHYGNKGQTAFEIDDVLSFGFFL